MSHTPHSVQPENPWLRNLMIVISIILIVGGQIYSHLDDTAIDNNNQALVTYNTGNTQSAIAQLESTVESAIKDDTKINIYKNLGYMYIDEEQNEKAVEAFKKALVLTKENSVDQHLVSAEIDLITGDIQSAHSKLLKAYEIAPKDFQVNNSLSLLYLDFEEFIDYEKSLEHAKKAYEYDEHKSVTSQFNLGLAHYYNDQYDEALKYFLAINAQQHPYVYAWITWSYAMKDDKENTQKYAQMTIDAGQELEQEILDYLES